MKLVQKKDLEVMIVVKTYPNPSMSFFDTVCTAGVDKFGNWIRLYPIPFRYLEKEKQYKKYQWIQVSVSKHKQDQRFESYRPNHDTIKLLEHIDTKNKWAKRKEILIPLAKESLEEIIQLYELNRYSLGMFKPKDVIDFSWEKVEPNWDRKYENAFRQQRLFGPEQKKLEKIPYQFKYTFTCNNNICKSHKISIMDWEIYQAYRSWRHKYSNNELLQKIKDKWLHCMFSKDRDSYFIVGSRHPYKTFLILGVFYPPV